VLLGWFEECGGGFLWGVLGGWGGEWGFGVIVKKNRPSNITPRMMGVRREIQGGILPFPPVTC